MKAISSLEESMFDVNNLLMKFVAVLAAFLAPIKASMFAVGFLVVADLITGVIAAKKRKEKITSFGLRHSVTKSLAYLGTIVVAYVAETFLVPDLPIVKVVTSMIGITEIQSFFENMNGITGINFWAEVLKKLQGRKIFPSKANRKSRRGK